MKLTIAPDILIKATDLVAKVADKHHRFVILGNIKLELNSDSLTLTASDLDVQLATKVRLPEGACVEAGSITVPATKFNEICKSLPKSASVTIQSLDDNRCQIIVGKSKFVLASLDASDFPDIGTPQNNKTLTLSRSALQEMITRTKFCIASQDVRHYLTGMLFHIHADNLTTVATDGHRMAIAQHNLASSYDELQIIVPGKAVGELERLFGELQKSLKQDSMVDFGLDSEFLHLQLNFGKPDDTGQASDELVVQLTARLIDGKFPDYNRVIPSDFAQVAYVQKGAITDVLRRVSILADERARGVVFSFEPELATVRTTNKTGEAVETLPLRLEGEPIELAFNDTYLKAVFGVLDNEIQIKMNNANSATLISQVGDERYQYVVMPVRI